VTGQRLALKNTASAIPKGSPLNLKAFEGPDLSWNNFKKTGQLNKN